MAPSRPLTAVQLVFAHDRRLAETVGVGDVALAHLVSTFIDSAPVTPVSRAAFSGDQLWLERVVAALASRAPMLLVDHRLCFSILRAAELGHADVVKWILDFLDDRLPVVIASEAAATVGDLDRVKRLRDILEFLWSKDKNPAWLDKRNFQAVVESGHVDAASWMREVMPSSRLARNELAGVCQRAAANGNLDMLQYLYQLEMFSMSDEALYSAARHGSGS
ncbi:hypothetical protein ATCC90586_004761 [Pythium insidiosum]|nr:hypothetical protein ATCC90586_004761 [Pythium insidiosum]